MTYRLHSWTSAFIVVAVALGLTIAAPVSPAEARIDGTAEARFVDSINAERDQRGLPRLQVSTDLRSVARSHSERMAREDHLRHNPNLASDVRNWRRLTENVGRGGSVGSLHTALMNSDGHRRNIIDRNVTQVGVGVEVRGGTVWVTQVFRQPSTTTSIRFSDVSSSSTHGSDVLSLARSGVTMGCSSDRFCPRRSVTRGEMATFLARSTGLLPRNPTTFSDASRAASHAANIEAIYRDGLTKGCGSSSFCPNRNVTRAEMATFLARARGLNHSGSRTRFTDVPNGSTHAGAIEALARAGITEGCGGGSQFCPNRSVTRQEMATFLVRAFRL